MNDKQTLIRQLLVAHHTHNAAAEELAARDLRHNYAELPDNVASIVNHKLGPRPGWKRPAQRHI